MWRTSRRRQQRGVVLIVVTLGAIAIAMFMGLAIDVGLFYMGRAALSKGVDAAALAGVRNLSFGNDQAKAVALSTFEVNYAASAVSSRQADVPEVDPQIVVDAAGNRSVVVNASVGMRTWFLPVAKMIGGDLDTLDVSASAEATRSKLVMGLALDRSNSMNNNGGAAALPGAVTDFIGFFDNASDRVGSSSFASYASLDYPIGFNFQQPIINSVESMVFDGWTFAEGSLQQAYDQIESVPAALNENVIRAIVFFTDGEANSFQGTFACNGGSRNLVMVPFYGYGSLPHYHDPADGSGENCPGVTQFQSVDGGTYYRDAMDNADDRTNIWDEGARRAEKVAADARADGIYVFSIGLGNDVDEAFLKRVANDPSSPGFDPSQPQGVAAIAPTAADLDDVFRMIAAKVLLRLTR